jgi:hypothetical protein
LTGYVEWFRKARDDLNEDAMEGRFNPENESDIKCHLYHSLLKQTKYFEPRHSIRSEFKLEGSTKRYDLAITSRHKLAEPRLLIEIKKTKREYDLKSAKNAGSSVLKKIKNDVAKLKEQEGKYPKRAILFVFRRVRARNLEANDRKEIEVNIRKEMSKLRIKLKREPITFDWIIVPS